MNAEQYLNKAAGIMAERGKQYDSPEGERSMGKTVAAFNAITGRNLTESDGWLLMLLLKQVRQWQKADFHADSAEDSVAYSALLAESLEREVDAPKKVTLQLAESDLKLLREAASTSAISVGIGDGLTFGDRP